MVYNRNREGDDIQIDDNGFPVRPALIGDSDAGAITTLFTSATTPMATSGGST